MGDIKKKVFIFVGTTAELIKLVPVIREFNARKVPFTIIASGQNDIRFEEFKSEIGKAKIITAVTPKGRKSSVFLFGIWAIRTFFSLLIGMRKNFRGLNKTNSLFIVHGDTVSSLMGALVASLYGLRLVHIESGLRSFNFFEPFPEELCRYIVARLSDVHFCPNEWSVSNLKTVRGIKINTKHNTLIESFWSVMAMKSKHPTVLQLREAKRRYFVLVVHRQEHVIFGKEKTKEIVRTVLDAVPRGILCVFLVHDLSKDFVHSLGLTSYKNAASKVMQIGRLPYADFMHLLDGSEFIVTDGGSNQEEMSYMGKPSLLLRNNTERIEGLNANVVLSKNQEDTINHFLQHYKSFRRPPVHIDKRPAEIIADYLFIHDR